MTYKVRGKSGNVVTLRTRNTFLHFNKVEVHHDTPSGEVVVGTLIVEKQPWGGGTKTYSFVPSEEGRALGFQGEREEGVRPTLTGAVRGL